MVVIAVAALMAAMMSVSAPLAFADPAPGKDVCKGGGFQALGFSNQGQCVKAANQAAKAGESFPPELETPPPPPNCYLNSEGGLSCRIGNDHFDCERDPVTGQPVNCVLVPL